jgi:hypothetical protein
MILRWFNNISVSKGSNKLYFFIGESNSGGIAENLDALPQELEETDIIQIWDNVENTSFKNLKIGDPDSNNLLGHTGLESYVGNTHGWELQLANRTKSGDLNGSNVFLCKCGQGGSKVENWVDDVLYQGINARTVFESRAANAIAEISNINSFPTTIYVFFSLGFNDAVAQTDGVVWKSKVQTMLTNIRSTLGNVPIYGTRITRVNPTYQAIDDAIQELGNELSYFTSIQTSDVSMRDALHWDYLGMKKIADRMINYTI